MQEEEENLAFLMHAALIQRFCYVDDSIIGCKILPSKQSKLAFIQKMAS